MSIQTRGIRRLAFQTLFQLDVRGELDADLVRESLEVPDEFGPRDVEKAFSLALEAYRDRAAADRTMESLAPTWPASRQPAVDRAILRLAHYEMTRKGTAARIVVNEAIELAKEFGTDKSPGFVNGLLDKVMKHLPAAPGTTESPDEQA